MVFTDYGLSELAAAPGGGYIPPTYMAIETHCAKIQNAGTLPIGATSVSFDVQVDQAGDIQLVLGAGTATQEVVTFTAPTLVSGKWVYPISATTKTHAFGDICTRQPRNSDTVANIISEMVVDSVLLPGQRLDTATGYPGSAGVFTIQFYMTGQQANGILAIVYLVDSLNIGTGNVHAYGVYGYDHSFPGGGSTSDLETDVVLTIVRA